MKHKLMKQDITMLLTKENDRKAVVSSERLVVNAV